jgi:hypothetical protein
MLSVLTEGGEDCGICMEDMAVGTCSRYAYFLERPRASCIMSYACLSFSFPCQHIYCDNCIKRLSDIVSADILSPKVSCPSCRKACARDEIEPVQLTATMQWDELLDIANEFGEMDQQRGRVMSTTDEEEEEHLRDNFINDGDTK